MTQTPPNPPQYGTPTPPQYGTPTPPQYGTPVAPSYPTPAAPPQYGTPVAPTFARPAPIMGDPTSTGASGPVAEQGTPGQKEFERLLAGLVHNKGSDMHLTVGERPRYRVAGALVPVAGEQPSTEEYLVGLLTEAIDAEGWKEFTETNELDTAYEMDEARGQAVTSRFRVNIFRSMDRTGVVARVIPTKIQTLDELGVLPQVKELADKPRGLILVCGPTGSGKSTTMAGLIDLINSTREERIFTFEDPIEFTHTSKKCLVSHREVGRDTASFVEGLKRVRREDPDIILIGEMRDYETIDAAIEAADTGHLVLGTLHTNSAPETISRIINAFPAERQNQVRTTLSSVLLAVICQVLVPAPKTPRGRVVATEIMMVTPAIRNNIRMNDIAAISNALTDTTAGSISLDAHLAELIRQGLITEKEALRKASSYNALMRQLGKDTDARKSL